jgi:hypothetical protein
MGLGRIPPNADCLKFNDLRPQRTPENPRRLFRNQQVAGSIPAGGSSFQTDTGDSVEAGLPVAFSYGFYRESKENYSPPEHIGRKTAGSIRARECTIDPNNHGS